MVKERLPFVHVERPPGVFLAESQVVVDKRSGTMVMLRAQSGNLDERESGIAAWRIL